MKIASLIGFALFATLGIPIAMAQTDDIFSFIPDGGRTLFGQILNNSTPDSQAYQMLTEQMNAADWRASIDGQSDAGFTGLDEWQKQTLANYLFYNMPLPAGTVAAGETPADWKDVLPRDGRDIALRYCQSCHIITVVITQDRTREAWLGTMNKPSHVEIELTQTEREALADYLVVNAGIPIDQVPPALRAGGATY